MSGLFSQKLFKNTVVYEFLTLSIAGVVPDCQICQSSDNKFSNNRENLVEGHHLAITGGKKRENWIKDSRMKRKCRIGERNCRKEHKQLPKSVLKNETNLRKRPPKEFEKTW